MKTVRITELTSPVFKELAAEWGTVIIPLGSIEELGSHGPLGTDYIISGHIAEIIGEDINALVAPPIPYGDTMELDFWPGTVSISTETLESYYREIAVSFHRHGIRNIVFLNCHSLNLRAADSACRKLHFEGIDCCIIDWWKSVSAALKGSDIFDSADYGHGGAVITSVIMAIKPDLVDLESAAEEAPAEILDFYSRHSMNSGSPFRAYSDFRSYCSSGAWGSLKRASAEKGEKAIKLAVDRIREFIEEYIKVNSSQ